MDELRLTSRHIPSPADHPPEGQKRFRLTIEYDGTAYSGWQRQINGPSVQQTLEEALAEERTLELESELDGRNDRRGRFEPDGRGRSCLRPVRAL